MAIRTLRIRAGRIGRKEFEVTYTIGSNQERFAPINEMPVGRVLFLGGSLTFGHGVEGNEAYPSVLGLKYWPRWRIVNRAVMGWGTAHAYMALFSELEGPEPPSMVIYAYMPQHLQRNHLRRSWLRVLQGFGRKSPHFEVEGGKLKFYGAVGLSEAIDYKDEVDAKEVEVTKALIKAMQKKSLEKNVPLIFVNLAEKGPASPVHPVSIRIQ